MGVVMELTQVGTQDAYLQEVKSPTCLPASQSAKYYYVVSQWLQSSCNC